MSVSDHPPTCDCSWWPLTQNVLQVWYCLKKSGTFQFRRFLKILKGAVRGVDVSHIWYRRQCFQAAPISSRIWLKALQPEISENIDDASSLEKYWPFNALVMTGRKIEMLSQLQREFSSVAQGGGHNYTSCLSSLRFEITEKESFTHHKDTLTILLCISFSSYDRTVTK